ncbi:hypothetical protein [Vulcanisaeta distributa]|uniref:hypothetical protein n=1 Tax=Vulcanisaeta distributa TaxID=164451 RepID=UPI0006CF2C3E|nr:hypothetical protein [Vulcanisaeta distributa]
MALVKLINRRYFIVIQRIRAQPHEELVRWRNILNANFSIGFNVFPELVLFQDGPRINSVHVVIRLPKGVHIRKKELALKFYDKMSNKPIEDIMSDTGVIMLDTSAGKNDKESTQAYCYIDSQALSRIINEELEKEREELEKLLELERKEVTSRQREDRKAVIIEPRISLRLHYNVTTLGIFNYTPIGAYLFSIITAILIHASIDVVSAVIGAMAAWVTGAVSVLLYVSDKPLLEEVYAKRHLILALILLLIAIAITLIYTTPLSHGL